MMKKYTLLLVLFCATQIHASEQKAPSPAGSPARPDRKPLSVLQVEASTAALAWELAHNAPVQNESIKLAMRERVTAIVGKAGFAPLKQKNSASQHFPNRVARTLTFQF